MTHSPRHPQLDQWLAYLRESAPDADLDRHLQGCAGCRSLLRTLKVTEGARHELHWKSAPVPQLDRALRMPRGKPLAAREQETSFEWSAADVRSESSGAVLDDARIVAGSCQSGEVSVLVHPPMDGPDWRFEVRTWLVSDTSSPVSVGLVHEDHVVATHELHDDQTLEFREVVGAGWELELHMPDGETIVLSDPFAEDDHLGSSA